MTISFHTIYILLGAKKYNQTKRMFTTANFCPYDVKKLAFMHRCASLSSGGGLDGWSR